MPPLGDFMNFTITPAAADKLASILDVSKGQKLRISIRGGGCAGFEYQFDITDEVEEGDAVYSQMGMEVIIDPISMTYLESAELDYVSEKFDSRFVLKNPHATTTCGCGQSFAA